MDRIQSNPASPSVANWLLNRILRKTDRDAVLGDFEETFAYLSEESYSHAVFWYWMQVVRSIPALVFTLSYWSGVMIRNYFVLTFRNLVKNRLSSIINLTGLSVAIGCSVVAFVFVHYTYNQDTFHENADSIFMVENVITVDGHQAKWALSPVPLAPALKREFPQVTHAVRIQRDVAIVKYGDNVFYENVKFADSDFFDMFTFPLQRGDKKSLLDRNAVFLSEEMALKYFGDDNAVDEQVLITIDDQFTHPFIVKGVAEKFPDNASFRFDVLLPYESRDMFGFDRFNDWASFTRASFIRLSDPSEIDILASKTEEYKQAQNAAREDWQIEEFIFDPFTNVVVNGYQVNGSMFVGAHPAGTIAFGLMGLLLLSLACFNYMNISIGSASRRLKEIGVRKALGSDRGQLIRQFLSENVILCSLALMLGVFFAYKLFLPGLNQIMSSFGFSVGLDLSNPVLWGFIALLLLITGIGAGAYPAFYISAFKATTVLRGEQKLKRNNMFTRILLVFQFAFSFFTIFAGIAVNQNVEYQKNRDWGYSPEQTIVVPIDGKKYYPAFRDAVEQNSDVLAVSGSDGHIGRGSNSGLISIAGKRHDVRRFKVGFNYAETLGLRLQAGRFFSQGFETDLTDAVVINETLARKANLTEPVGKALILEDHKYTIIGVVEDFHYLNFYNPIQPALLQMAPSENFKYLSVRTKPGAAARTAGFLEQTWQKLIPDAPYAGFFQDSVFDFLYRQNSARQRIAGFSAIIALFLSCMGLFGLAILNITRRMKEFSIRKVLGASIMDVTRLMNRELVWLILIATVIAAPLSYFAMNKLLDAIFVYRVDLTASPLVITLVCLLATAVLTVSSQIYKVISSNPVDTLRVE